MLLKYARDLINKSHLYRLFLISMSVIGLSSAQAADENQAVFLLYHHVSTDTPPVTSTSPELFIQHLAYLKAEGFNIISLPDAIDHLQNTLPLPDKTAVITFDDAYLSIYEQAFPLLQEYQWPFTIFVSTGLVGSNKALYLNWEQLTEMSDYGALIANHTVSHLHMLEMLDGENNAQWISRLENEILEAQASIDENIGKNTGKYFAYPYGEYTPQIQAMVKRLGFTGFGQHSGPAGVGSDFTALPRFTFSGIYASMNTFPTKVNSLYYDIKLLQPLSPVTSNPSPDALIEVGAGYPGDRLTCYNNGELINIQQGPTADQFLISTDIQNTGRRFRYNCTAPGPNGRFYWYSMIFVNPEKPE